ncbi:MAG: uracil-DNA glycosylase [Muribaculaceae bacterium]|nr:uracil-DNA glycosylase [Muribaculaceae bacterium]
MDVKIEQSWKEALAAEWEKPYFQTLTAFVRDRYSRATIYPPAARIFAAFDTTPIDKVKVVILGQDPYHGPGQANGLCFSVASDIKLPPSLVNIFKEVFTDLNLPVMPDNGDLSRWAQQGVLLLNDTLTVEAGQAGSHQGRGWEQLTMAAVECLNRRCEHLVFMLWGSHAQKKGAFIDRTRHLVLESPHPSPLSAHRGFFGNHHFSRANQYLTEHNKTPIDWR